MSKPMLLADFVRLPPIVRGDVVEGLAAAIDIVAERGAQSHRFLRFGWYAAALAAYGGRARTLVVEQDDAPVLTLPFIHRGPAMLRLAAIPGCYWPFRSFGLALEGSEIVLKTALSTLAGHLNGLRIGPVYDTDPAVAPLIAAARANGWTAIDRPIGESGAIDLHPVVDGQPWPYNSPRRKNRFQEKRLAEHGVPEWRFLSGGDWPAAFDTLGSIEETNWTSHATDRTDMKFTRDGHRAFWQAAVADSVLATMFRGALLSVDGEPAAFSFYIDTGDLMYAIADSHDPRLAKRSPDKLRIDAPVRDWILLRPGLPTLAGRLFGWHWRRSGRHTRR